MPKSNTRIFDHTESVQIDLHHPSIQDSSSHASFHSAHTNPNRFNHKGSLMQLSLSNQQLSSLLMQSSHQGAKLSLHKHSQPHNHNHSTHSNNLHGNSVSSHETAMMNLTFGSGSATTRVINHQSLLHRVSPLRMETNGDHGAHTQRRKAKKAESNDFAS